MIPCIILILFFVGIWVDFLPKRNTQTRRELVLYGVLLAGAFFILILASIGLLLPSPNLFIKQVVGFLFFQQS